jgi:hypothetical protein
MQGIAVLTDTGQLHDAVAGISSLDSDMSRAAALCDIAGRLARSGQTGDLLHLAQNAYVLGSITGTHERISALTGLGRILALSLR